MNRTILGLACILSFFAYQGACAQTDTFSDDDEQLFNQTIKSHEYAYDRTALLEFYLSLLNDDTELQEDEQEYLSTEQSDYSPVLSDQDIIKAKKLSKQQVLMMAVHNDDREMANEAIEDVDCDSEVDEDGHNIYQTWKTQTHSIIRAARQGDRHALEDFKNLGTNILPIGSSAPLHKVAKYICDNPTGTFLHHAVCKGSELMIAYLLENGADIHKESQGRPPLHTAVINGKTTETKLLLREGVNVHQESSTSGDQAIHLASAGDNVQILESLLLYGADVKAKTMLGDEPIHIAAETGSPQIMQKIIEHGADIFTRDSSGYTAVDRAVRAGNINLIDILSRHIPHGEKSAIGDEPIHVVAETGSPAEVQELIEQGANIFARDGSGYTAVDRAVRAGNIKVVKLLSQHIPQVHPTKLFIHLLEQKFNHKDNDDQDLNN